MNTKNFNVALMQLRPEATTARNLEIGLFYCKVAKIMGADIALFPEMWSNGYTPKSILVYLILAKDC